MATQRLLDLVVQHLQRRVGDLAASWAPDLLVVVRGMCLDEGIPPGIDREISFGTCGVSTSSSTEWRDITPAQVGELIGALAAAGLPGTPDLDGVVDTGDYAHITVVSGAVDGVAFHVTLTQMQSGYEGAHAQGFADAMRLLLAVAKIDPSDDRWWAMTRVS